MLNRLIFIVVVLLTGAGCSSDSAADSGKRLEEIQLENKNSVSKIIRSPVSASGLRDTINVARMEFTEERFEFGTVADGDVVEHDFHFKNTGKVPLLINDARSTCGCTVPEWPKAPIAPGESGIISVKFNTTKKTGNQQKPIIITANTYPSVTKVYLEGYVTEAKQ